MAAVKPKKEETVLQLSVPMTYVKSTKGTHVYGEAEADSGITTLYISKAVFAGEAPKQIVVNVNEA